MSETYKFEDDFIHYRDEGEKAYAKTDYDNVIFYYAKAGVNAPWAKFFTAMALKDKAYDNVKNADYLVNRFINNQLTSYSIEDFMNGVEPIYDFDLAEKQYKMALELFDSYNNSGDVSYQKESNIQLRVCKDRLNDLPSKVTSFNKTMPQLIEYRKKVIEAKKEAERVAYMKRLAAEKAIEQERIERVQKQKAIMLGFLDIFSKSLTNSFSGTSNNNSIQTNTGFTSVSAGTSSNNSNNATKIADWQSRKANAQRQLEKYQQQLIKDPNNAALKHNIRSTEEIIRTCEQTLSTLR